MSGDNYNIVLLKPILCLKFYRNNNKSSINIINNNRSSNNHNHNHNNNSFTNNSQRNSWKRFSKRWYWRQRTGAKVWRSWPRTGPGCWRLGWCFDRIRKFNNNNSKTRNQSWNGSAYWRGTWLFKKNHI